MRSFLVNVESNTSDPDHRTRLLSRALRGVLSTHHSRRCGQLYSLSNSGARAGSSWLSESDRESVRWTFRPGESVWNGEAGVSTGWAGAVRLWKRATGKWKHLIGNEQSYTRKLSLWWGLKVNSLNYYRNTNLNQLWIIENQQIRFLFAEINQVS